MDLFDLTGKTAIVTGGSRGLGKGMAEGLAKAGAKIVITSASEKVFAAEKELREKGYDVTGMICDVSDPKQTEQVFFQAVDALGGKLDILVNNAGIQRSHPSEDFPMEEWYEVLQVNLTSVFQLSQLAGRKMIADGGGKIINIASMLSFFGNVTVPAYAAAKGGVAQLTKALSNEWASKGVCVNAIAPGFMATDMNAVMVKNEKPDGGILGRIPMKRWGTPQDMEGIVVFLASAASDYVTGAVIPVDGGFLGR